MTDYPLTSINLRSAMRILIVSTLLAIAGCAGEAVRVEFPIDHPANPQATESHFTPPQNIFQTDMAVTEGAPAADSNMKHKMPPKSSQQQPHMQHQMSPPKQSPPDAASKQKPAHKQSDHMHQEHNQ